jgi:hypothetical protein
MARLWHRNDPVPAGDTQVIDRTDGSVTEPVVAQNVDPTATGRATVVDNESPAVTEERPEPISEERIVSRPVEHGVVTDGTAPDVPATDEREIERERKREAAPGRARGSLTANIGLIISVAGICAVLTGLLAPEGLVLGAIGVIISFAGFLAGRRPGVTGSGAATLGLAVGLGAVALAVLAMTGNYTWPNSKTDQARVWHDWFVNQWSWLRRF